MNETCLKIGVPKDSRSSRRSKSCGVMMADGNFSSDRRNYTQRKEMIGATRPKSERIRNRKPYRRFVEEDEERSAWKEIDGRRKRSGKRNDERNSGAFRSTISPSSLRFEVFRYDRKYRMEVKDPDGTWRKNVQLYAEKNCPSRVVLFFGSGEYEGLDNAYTLENGVLRDGDGDVVVYRNKRDIFKRKSKCSDRKNYDRSDNRSKRGKVMEKKSCKGGRQKSPWDIFRNRVRGQLAQLRFHEMFIQSYESDGWNRSGDRSRGKKLKPERELRNARRKCRQCKLNIQNCLKELCENGRESERKLDKSAYDGAYVLANKIFCAVCGSDECDQIGNDILLCDRANCNRAFHQLCCDPPVTDVGGANDHWFCRRCQCESDCLVLINDHFDTTFETWKDVFLLETAPIESPRPRHQRVARPKVLCRSNHVCKEYTAGEEVRVCDMCENDIEEDEHFFMCRKCEYDCCEYCAYGKPRRKRLSRGHKRPPRRLVTLQSSGNAEAGHAEWDKFDWGSDSDSEDYHASSSSEEDEEDSWENEMDEIHDLASPRGRGRRRKKKVDYVALAGVLFGGTNERAESCDDEEFQESSRLRPEDVDVKLSEMVNE